MAAQGKSRECGQKAGMCEDTRIKWRGMGNQGKAVTHVAKAKKKKRGKNHKWPKKTGPPEKGRRAMTDGARKQGGAGRENSDSPSGYPMGKGKRMYSTGRWCCSTVTRTGVSAPPHPKIKKDACRKFPTPSKMADSRRPPARARQEGGPARTTRKNMKGGAQKFRKGRGKKKEEFRKKTPQTPLFDQKTTNVTRTMATGCTRGTRGLKMSIHLQKSDTGKRIGTRI